nr:efflux RND transporter periplasmic adaptor subunit [uncultured Desulfobulbus sp.]
MNESPNHPRLPPASGARAYLLWKHLPSLVLIGLLASIAGLSLVVKERKAGLEAAKKSAHVSAKKLVNAVLLDLQPRPMADVINLPGTIEPWTRLELMAKVSGAIAEIKVREGDRVSAGQVLARIEPDEYRIALDAARAAYSLAQSDYERSRAMHKTNVVPMAKLDAAAAQLRSTRAEMERAELQLARCTITAPMDAVIKRLEAKVGLYLSVGDPLAELLAIDRVKAVIGIPESDIDAVRRIETVALNLKALGNREVIGTKLFVSPAPENTAHLFRFEAAIDNPDHAILPGMFFRARLVKRHIDQALAVPLYAVVSRNNEQFVYLAEGEKVRKQPVKLGVIQQWQVEVTQGLHPGDRILIEGQREVEDGQPIKVIRVITDPDKLLP